jgi:hypothetical protein
MGRLDQLLFGRRQGAAEAYHQRITQHVGVDVLGDRGPCTPARSG